ncbi:hypothetical protein MPH_08650 [Macrophomina phaseolina MS6]|uniref:Uncharacterized protein n=2 Tax=Macrophomina phaseolina TaxID=35725 RepID=K2RMZ7_MACPH|nr:hypothetical protein MPH_08650 [Macrophomina phaseolina MS6]KAH7051997.1 hypothetical protein B0J12DRAFT_60709 [Macrophomina phaseolina]
MQFSTSVLASLLSISSMASARILGISLPKQVAAGQNFTAFINTLQSIDIQSTTDVAITFGAAPAEYALQKTLGTQLLGQKALGPELSNIQTNISIPLTVPESFQQGETVVTAALFSLSGSRYSGVINYFNVTVNVASVTDASEFVSSTGSIIVY